MTYLRVFPLFCTSLEVTHQVETVSSTFMVEACYMEVQVCLVVSVSLLESEWVASGLGM